MKKHSADHRNSPTRIGATVNPPNFVTIFAVDAMFYHGARAAFVRAQAAKKGLERAERRVLKLDKEIEAIAEQAARDEFACREVLHPLMSEREQEQGRLVVAHGPVIQMLALVHILSAASLEAHINLRAADMLTGPSNDAFERVSLHAKWLFFPRLQGLTGFDVGAEPFQSFERLVKARNDLVHYKQSTGGPQSGARRRYEPYFLEEIRFDFAQRLALTFAGAERSLGAVQGMVKGLAKQLGEREPRWLVSSTPLYLQARRMPKRETK